MRTHDGFKNLDPIEERFLAETRRKLHARDPWTRGLYAEALVASVLPGAQLATHSASPHDIEWSANEQPITIAVRATGTYSMDYHEIDNPKPFAGSWDFSKVKEAWDPSTRAFRQVNGQTIKRRCWADIAVLCHHTSLNISDGWSMFVLRGDDIETWPTKKLTPNALRAKACESCSLHQLLSVIRNYT